MEEISSYTALINPNTGINGPDILDQIDSGQPFQIIDYVYAAFREIFPVKTLAVLTVSVQEAAKIGKPPISLNLASPISYDLLIISNPNKNATLTVNGVINNSLLISSVQFNIDVTIFVPFTPYIPNVGDAPVIIISDFFDMGPGYTLNILGSNLSELSQTRDIIVSNGFLNTRDINADGSSIQLNIPFSTVFVNNFIAIMTSQGSQTLSTFSHYVSIDTTDETLVLDLITPRVSYATLPAPPPIVLANPKCDDFLAYIFDGQVTQHNVNRLIIASVFTADILPAAYAVGWAFYKLGNCPSPVPKKKRTHVDLIRFYEVPKRKTFIKAISRESIFKALISEQVTVSMPTFQGAGTLSNVNPSQPIYLSNTPYIATGLNLLAVIPFMTDTVQDGSEYALTQNNDSYNNSGSIFRRPVNIIADYTLKQFCGNVFLVNASLGDITITIPVGDISKDRVMEFKRTDSTSNSVTIISPGGIDDYKIYKLNICKKHSGKLPYVRLYGDGVKLYVFK